MQDKKSAIIIGAGVGGLALANILAKAGYQVDIYEKNDGPGGRMGILEKDGFTFDTGPSWYLMKDVFEDYFKLFGKTTKDFYNLKRLDTAYKVFFDDTQPVTIKANLKNNLSAFESLEGGSGKKLEQYLKRAERNYQTSLDYFLYNPFKRPSQIVSLDLIKNLPSFLSIFTSSLHKFISRSFSRLELQQILEYPSVFLGASPFNTPALYQLMSYLDFKEGVFYPEKDGIYAVTKALCSIGEDLGVRYHYGSDVRMIIVEDNIAKGITLDSEKVYADLVISNADLHFTETKLLETKYQTYTETYWQKRDVGPSALLLYLGVKGSLPELDHHNLFFVKEWKQNFDSIYQQKIWPDRASIYVSKTTQTDRKTAPKNHENIFVLVPLPASSIKSQKDEDKFVERYLKQLEEMSGISDLRNRIVTKEVRSPQYFGETFNSWQNTALGMSHTLRQTAFLRPSIKSKKVKNLYYVGAGTQPGIGVPMCLISAQLVYKYLAKDRSISAPKDIKKIVL